MYQAEGGKRLGGKDWSMFHGYVSLTELFRNFRFWWELLMGVIIWNVTISVLSRFFYITAPYMEVLQFSNNIHSGWMLPCKLLLHSNCDYNFNRNLEASNFGRFMAGGVQEHKKLRQLEAGSYSGSKKLWRGVQYNNSHIPKYSPPGRWKHLNKWRKIFVIK